MRMGNFKNIYDQFVIEIYLKCYGESRSIILRSEEVFKKKKLTFGLDSQSCNILGSGGRERD